MFDAATNGSESVVLDAEDVTAGARPTPRPGGRREGPDAPEAPGGALPSSGSALPGPTRSRLERSGFRAVERRAGPSIGRPGAATRRRHRLTEAPGGVIIYKTGRNNRNKTGSTVRAPSGPGMQVTTEVVAMRSALTAKAIEQGAGLEGDRAPATAQGSPRRCVADCHRCGWRLEVRRVSRRDRRSAPVLEGFGWICDECLGDLAAVTSGPRPRLHVADALTVLHVPQALAGRRATDRSVA